MTTTSALVLASGLSVSAVACELLRAGPSGVVVEVTDGDTVVLDTGIKVRLIGIQAPKLPLGRAGFETWPLAEEAQEILAELVLGEEVQLRYGEAEWDRHGRALAHLFLDEVWIQEALLQQGLARVYSFADNRLCLDALYAAEAQARIERLGIWTHAYYAVRDAHDPHALLAHVDGYELVEGRVLNAERVGSRIYLNFGRYWKEDFTVVIERAALKLFEAAGRDPLALEDKVIRVRGWVTEHDGPRITVTHPEQIEILAHR